MKQYSYKKKKVLDYQVFNLMLSQVGCKHMVRYYQDDDRKKLRHQGVLYQNMYKLDIDKCYIKLTFMKWDVNTCSYDGVATYSFNLAGKTQDDMKQRAKIIDDNALTGKEAFALFQKMSHKAVVDLSIYDWAKEYFKTDASGKMIIRSPDAMLFTNPKFNNKRTPNCYGYDMHSAYGYALKQPIPNVLCPKIGWDVVKKNHIGYVVDFNSKGWQTLQPVFTQGEYCSIQFPLMDSPFIETVDKLYNMKLKAEKNRKKYRPGTKEWNRWNDYYLRKKALINFAVGYSKLKNPFLQSCIVGRTYRYMSFKIQQYSGHIAYCNTDSLYSDIPLDLPIGDNVGEFRLEHEKESLALRNTQYQWNDGVPTYRGVAKPLFKKFKKENGRNYDLLLDPTPTTKVYNSYEIIECKVDDRTIYKIKEKEILG